MNQERLYILVGLFVGGALSLILLMGLYVYNEQLHEKIETYVMFFKGSLSGLHVGSDVTYRGVKIGEVRLIELTENKEKNKIKIPVYVQFFVERSFIGSKNPIELLISKGYVANIKKPNFITGVSSINLIKLKNNPPPKIKETSYHDYPVYPTNNQPKHYTNLSETISAAQQAFENISQFTKSERIIGAFDSTKNMAVSMDRLIKDLDSLIKPTIANINQSLDKIATLTTNLEHSLPPMFVNVNQSLKELSTFALNLDQLMPPMIAIFSESMKQISGAANSTQNLTDYLARHPESLLRGKS